MGIELATLATIGSVVSGVQGVMGFIQGQQQAGMIRQQTAYNDAVERNRRATEEMQQRRQLTLAQGEARTRAAGSGVTLGSFEDVLNDNQEQGLLDIALGAYDSQVTRQRINYEGGVLQSEARSQGVSSLLSGASGVSSGMERRSEAIRLQNQQRATGKLAGTR